MTQFVQRLSFGLIFALLLLTAIYYSYNPQFQPIFVLIGALIVSGALWEFYQIGHIKGFEPLVKIGLAASILYTVSTQLAPLLPFVVLFFTLLTCFAYYFIDGKSPYANVAITLFGLVYLTIPLTTMMQINYFPFESTQDGRWWFVYLLFVTKFTDTGAYFTGKAFGKHKLTPYISPNKTWEGAAGGLLFGVLISFLLSSYLPKESFALTTTDSIWLGLLLSATAQFGDLAESLLKRDMGIKDSSSIPGLGGLLDIVDSLVFTAPLLYIFLIIQGA